MNMARLWVSNGKSGYILINGYELIFENEFKDIKFGVHKAINYRDKTFKIVGGWTVTCLVTGAHAFGGGTKKEAIKNFTEFINRKGIDYINYVINDTKEKFGLVNYDKITHDLT